MVKILIAEDDRDIRELVILTLGFNGFAVTGVEDGRFAVEEASQNSYDLILLDVNMPRATGYEACREIRQDGMNQKTPIIILSASGQEEERQQGLEAGANGYVMKPFVPDVLVQKINETMKIQKRNTLRQLLFLFIKPPFILKLLAL